MKRLNKATQGKITLLNLAAVSYTFPESRMPAVYMNIDVSRLLKRENESEQIRLFDPTNGLLLINLSWKIVCLANMTS